LVGIGIATIWNARESNPRLLWLLPMAVAMTIAVQLHLLDRFPIWRQRLEPPLVGGAILLCLGILVLIRVRSAREGWSPLGSAVMTMAIAVILLAPATWATLTSADAATGVPNPAAGPSAPASAATNARLEAIVASASLGHGAAKGPATADPSTADVTAYLVKHQGSYRYLVATRWAHDAWGMILSTGDPVMALGGFTGRDPILNPTTFARTIAAGNVRYAWGNFGRKVTGRKPRTIDEWVATQCTMVPAQSVSATSSGPKVAWGALKLYDCRKAAQAATHTPAASAGGSSKGHTPYQPTGTHGTTPTSGDARNGANATPPVTTPTPTTTPIANGPAPDAAHDAAPAPNVAAHNESEHPS
ncbi:MAG: hypothetical protein ACTHMX_15055, partial [Thermomicrobiales bacterium]